MAEIELSFDAKFLAGALFAMMEPGVGTLTFGMRESKPTARTQAALDELVAKNAAMVRPFNKFGGVVYTPLRTFRRPTAPEEKRAGPWVVIEKIKGRDSTHG